MSRSPHLPGYSARHKRVVRARGPARMQTCVRCPAQARDWAQLHTEDGEDPWADYAPLCRRCHIAYDGNNNGDPGIGQRRGDQQRAKTHCPARHRYTPENTYLSADGRRTCRTCALGHPPV